MSNELYMQNLNGYGVRYEDGSDIMRVAYSFGGGGIGLFEVPDSPDSVSVPRITPYAGEKLSPGNWNEGQFDDTRYAFEVVVNGPVRSMIKAKTMNWNTGGGSYELEQYYTAYTNQSYSTCRVKFTRFLPLEPGTMFGCGIRKNAMEFDSFQEDNIVMTFGKDELSDPDDDTGLRKMVVDFVGNALVVKNAYNPAYQYVPGLEGNHTFRIPVTGDRSFEYMIFAAWSEGAVYNTPETFREYVLKTAREYENPVQVGFEGVEMKED